MTQPDDLITVREAYLAMYDYWLIAWKRTRSDDIGNLLGDLSFLSNGSTADPQAWGDWLESLERAREGKVDALLHISAPE